MNKLKSALSLVFLILFGCLNAGAASSDYERSMISWGDNRPDFKFDDDLQNLIISVHNGIPAEDFRKANGWTVEKYDQTVAFLESKGFMKKAGKEARLLCLVINDGDGKRLREYAEPISRAIADSILKMKDEIGRSYAATRLAASRSFDSMAFFLMSDVLLDNWQIRNVEGEFLKAQRPLRHGKNYYFAFLENVTKDREAFGIYGNQVSPEYCIYGNNRKKLDSGKIAPLIPSFPLLNQEDDDKLAAMAGAYKPVLLEILESNRPYAGEIFRKTGYAEEITFEEFFIWWYHFIYSRATDILAEKGALTIPADGNFFYRYAD